MNHTRFPKEDHLPDWARRNSKVTKDDRVQQFTEVGNYENKKMADLGNSQLQAYVSYIS